MVPFNNIRVVTVMMASSVATLDSRRVLVLFPNQSISVRYVFHPFLLEPILPTPNFVHSLLYFIKLQI